MKQTNAKTLNTIMHDLYSKLLIILISTIIKSASIKYSIVKLKNKETVNFTSCMSITIEKILKELLYTQEINELCRLQQLKIILGQNFYNKFKFIIKNLY